MITDTLVILTFILKIIRVVFGARGCGPPRFKIKTETVSILCFPAFDRMFTTTHLSDHVQDHMTSRLHQPERVGALP